MTITKKSNRLPSQEQIAELVKTIHADEPEKSREATEKLIRPYLRMVMKIAHEEGAATKEVVEEGNIGLYIAATKFRPEQDGDFTSYAVWNIKQSTRRAMAASLPESNVVRIKTDNGGVKQ